MAKYLNINRVGEGLSRVINFLFNIRKIISEDKCHNVSRLDYDPHPQKVKKPQAYIPLPNILYKNDMGDFYVNTGRYYISIAPNIAERIFCDSPIYGAALSNYPTKSTTV